MSLHRESRKLGKDLIGVRTSDLRPPHFLQSEISDEERYLFQITGYIK